MASGWHGKAVATWQKALWILAILYVLAKFGAQAGHAVSQVVNGFNQFGQSLNSH